MFGLFECWDVDEFGKMFCVYVYDGIDGVDDDVLVVFVMCEFWDVESMCVLNIGGFYL